MNKNLWDLMNRLGLAEYWDLWITDSESRMTEITGKMYADRADFINHLYSPHYDMGAFDLERVALPYPQTEDCHVKKTCEPPLDKIYKIMNPQVAIDLPEVNTFLERFSLSNAAVSSIIYRKEDPASNITWK